MDSLLTCLVNHRLIIPLFSFVYLLSFTSVVFRNNLNWLHKYFLKLVGFAGYLWRIGRLHAASYGLLLVAKVHDR